MSSEIRNEISKCPYHGEGIPQKHPTGKGQTNRDWWPNSLNLKVLSFSGEVLYELNKNYLLQQNSTMKAESLSIDWLNKNFDPNSSLLVARNGWLTG